MKIKMAPAADVIGACHGLIRITLHAIIFVIFFSDSRHILLFSHHYPRVIIE